MAYHGTPSALNAASILKDGWEVGSGNAFGDGIYFSQDLAEAKRYAGASGVYLRCLIRLGKSCTWNAETQRQYDAWCRARNVRPDNSAVAAFLLKRGFDTVVSGDMIVVLQPRYANPSAWRRKIFRIRVLSVHRAAGDGRVFV